MAITISKSNLGTVAISFDTQGVCGIQFEDNMWSSPSSIDDITIDVNQVLAVINGETNDISFPIHVSGTPFQLKVWKAIREIPVGETATYADIAARIGSPKAVRAVGTACGRNRLAVIIPCHRVIKSDGGLGGYRWGLEIKRKLLEREAKV